MSLDVEGYLYIRGRADDLIIRGGANIHPESVEAEIQLLPGVRDVAVVGRPDPELGQVPVAFVVTQGDIGIAELTTHCVRKLPGYMVPAEFFLVEKLPRSVTGKLQRRVLPQGLSD